jgi:hypothetical protein
VTESNQRHDWVEIYPNIPWFVGTPRRAFQCKHCHELRTGEPSPAPPGIGWSGAFYVWNGTDFCGLEALERVREGQRRCDAGTGIESLAAFLGTRALGHCYVGDELIAPPIETLEQGPTEPSAGAVSARPANPWRDVIPRCSWGGCNRLSTKWIARTVANCDEHGSQYLQDTPWAELARSEGL